MLVDDEKNPYDYVEVKGTAEGRTKGADAHIDALAKKYLGQDSYPFRQEGEQRITFLVSPTRVRHQKQGLVRPGRAPCARPAPTRPPGPRRTCR